MVYFSSVSSLYRSLDHESIQLLEKAIWLGRLGLYDKSLSIFEDYLSEKRTIPVVVYEKSIVYRAQGKVGDACRSLSEFLEHSSEDDFDLPEYRLLALLLALVEVYHQGQIERAVREIDRTRIWLQYIAVASYTDVEVSIASCFVLVENLLFWSSNRSLRANSDIPKPNNVHRQWAGLADLRAYLVTSGRLGEACFLQVMTSTPMIYSPESRVTLYRETLSRLPEALEDDRLHQKLLLIRLNLKINLVETLVDPETSSFPQREASAAVKDMVQDLNKLQSTFSLGPDLVKRTGFYLRLCLARIKLISRSNWQERYLKHMLLVQKHTTDCPREITACYREAALAAKTLYQRTGNVVWRKRSGILFEKKEEYEFRVLGDILTPLIEHTENIASSDLDFTTMSGEEVRHIAGWYEQYENEHRGFAVPLIVHRTSGLKVRLYFALSDNFRGISEMMKLNEWKEKLPSTLLENENTEQAVSNSDLGDEYHSGDGNVQYLEGNPTMLSRFVFDLVQQMTQKVESDSFWMEGFPGRESLVDWLKDDFRSGNLSQQELEAIFQRDDTDGGLDHPEVDDKSSDLGEELPSFAQMMASFSRKFDIDDSPSPESEDPTSQTSPLPPTLLKLNADNIAENICGPFGHQISEDLWRRRRLALTTWLRRPSNVPQIRKDLVLVFVHELRARHFAGTFLQRAQSNGSPTDPILSWVILQKWIQKWQECISTFDASHPYLRAIPGVGSYNMGPKTQIADHFLMFACCVWATDLDSNINDMLSSSEIMGLNDEVIRFSRELRCFYEAEGRMEMLGKCLSRLGILSLLRIYMNLEGPKDIILKWREEGLQFLRHADDIFSSKLHRHRGANILESLGNKEDSQTFRASHFIPQAALALLQLPDGLRKQDYSLIWEWVQRSKAKALHSVMNWRDEHGSVRHNADQDDLFSDVIEDEKDRLISFADLDRMTSLSGNSEVVYVDWFSVPRFPGQSSGQLFMIIVKAGAQIIIEDLGMTDNDILEWKGIRFNREQNMFQGGRDLEDEMSKPRNQSPLSDLKPLVSPLLQHTAASSVLVCCPSNYLHQIPLHALELPDGTVLIRRNLVIYCYSLSVLRYNFFKAREFNQEGSSANPKQVAIFGDIAKGKKIEEYQTGRNNIRQLAEWFDVRPYLRNRATKSALLEVAPQSALIHFHTHVGSLDANPLAHAISLWTDPNPLPQLMPNEIKRHPWSSLMFPNSAYSEYASSLEEKSITAGEVCQLVNLPSPCHVTLIACGGGRLRVHPGDEVMGLIPAFMMKGATSAIGTLWSITDVAGAAFTTVFYKSMKIEADKLKSKGGGLSLIDMAKTFQAAIIALDRDEDLAPYDWAGFVFHGWWMYEPPVLTEAEHPWNYFDSLNWRL